MPEQPAPRPVSPRDDTTVADLGTLAAMGRADTPPVPSPDPPRRRTPPPPPTPASETQAASLTDALADTGTTTTADDQAAVDALARMDAATVAAVERWIRRGASPDTRPPRT